MAWKNSFFVALCALGPMSACDADPEAEPQEIRVRVALQNVSSPGAIEGQDILLAPGTWVVLREGALLYESGSPATFGFEQLAEDGTTPPIVVELDQDPGVAEVGTFATQRPGENYDDNPIGPGDRIEFELTAMSNHRLGLAAMFVQSNDVVIATPEDGLPLSDLLATQSLDVTEQFRLIDAGTEANEEPGLGPNQPPRQSAPGVGGPGEGIVSEVTDPFTYPVLRSYLSVTLEHVDNIDPI